MAFDAGNSQCNCRSAGEVSSHNLRIDFSLLPIAMETASHSCPSVYLQTDDPEATAC